MPSFEAARRFRIIWMLSKKGSDERGLAASLVVSR
jgi:hypothetical protein